MNKIFSFIVLVLFALGGCAAPSINLVSGANVVKIAKSDPPDNYKEIGPVTAIDGEGCGAFGYRGTYNRAVLRLKNKTFGMGGDYVQIMTLTEPHFRPGCFDNIYRISGTAFKKFKENPSPLPITETQKTGADKLKDLKKLLDDGIITQEEFKEQKQKILEEGI